MSSRFRYILWLIPALGLLAFVYTARWAPAEINDAQEYLQLAENLSAHNVNYAGDLNSERDFRLYSKRPPLYAFFINIAALGNPLVIKGIQTLLILFLFMLSVQILREMEKERYTALLTLLFAISLPLYFTAQFVMADLLLAVLVVTIFYLMLRYSKEKDLRSLWSISLLWALAIWCKPIVFPTVIVGLFLLVWRFRHYRPLLVVLLSAGSLVVHNQRLTSVYHVSSITVINRSHYNAKLLIASHYGKDSAEAYTADERFAIPHSKTAFRTYSEQLNQRANATLLAHPWAYVRIQCLGMIKSLLDPGRFEVYTYFDQETRSESLTELLYAGNWSEVKQKMSEDRLLLLFFLVLLLFSLIKLIGFAIAVFSLNKVNMLLTAFILYFVVLAGPLGAFRFLLPVFPLFLVLSSLGLGKLLRLQKGAEG